MADLTSGDLFKIGIEDARVRHGALVNLILFTDAQAFGLMRLYVTLGLGAASGAIATLYGSFPLPIFAAWSLAAAAVTLSIGVYFCLRTIETAPINLPGRPPDFWLWAADRGSNATSAIFTAYMTNLEAKQRQNEALNRKGAMAFRVAKLCGWATPLSALAGGFGAAAITAL